MTSNNNSTKYKIVIIFNVLLAVPATLFLLEILNGNQVSDVYAELGVFFLIYFIVAAIFSFIITD